jgi:hypothetical protein
VQDFYIARSREHLFELTRQILIQYHGHLRGETHYLFGQEIYISTPCQRHNRESVPELVRHTQDIPAD